MSAMHYGYGSGGRRKKAWRYPGVPIPFRLQGKYSNKGDLS